MSSKKKGGKGGKGKKALKREALDAIPLQAELSGVLDKFCGNGFKPRYFKITAGLLKYYREEPTEGSPQEGVAITWINGLADEIDHQALVQDPKRELQFQHHDHVFRLRAQTPELRQIWLAHLTKLVKNVSKSQYIYGSVVQCVEEGEQSRSFAYLTDGALVLCPAPLAIAALDFPPSGGGAARASVQASAIEPGMKVRMDGKAKPFVVLKVLDGRAHVQMEGSTMKKWVEFDQLSALIAGETSKSTGAPGDIEAEIAAVEPKEYPMAHVTELQEGFDDGASALSEDARLEFQFLLFSKPSRFRVEDVEVQLKWMQTLEQEVAAAAATKDDAVTMVHQLLSTHLEQAPLVDEDIHYILFFQREGDDEEDEAEKASFRVENTARDAHMTAAYEDEFSPIGQWLSSLGIAKSQEYGKLMEVTHEMEMEDIPHLTEKNLVDMGITAVGPRNRILREIAFMNNKNKDPTIAADGTSAVMQIQFYLPFSPLVVSDDIPLDMTVQDLKKKLLVDTIRQKDGSKAKLPKAEEMEAMAAAHQVTVVAQLGHWDEEVALESSSVLREVPFIFYCFQNQKTPRLALQETQTAFHKKAMLETIVTSGHEITADAGDAGGAHGAFAHLGNSTQLKRLRKVMSGVRHLVEVDSSSSKRAMLMRRTLLASIDMPCKIGDITEFAILVYPVSASRFESHSMVCGVDMTVREVLDTFISDYEGGRWGKVLNERKRAGVVLKRFGLAEYLYDDDKVSDYNFVRHAIRAREVVKFTLDFSQLFEEMREAALVAPPPVPKELKLVMREVAWCSPQYVADIEEADRDEDEDEEDEEQQLAADLEAAGSTPAHLEELDRNPLTNLTSEEKTLLWQHRDEIFFRNKPRMLAKVISSVPSWTDLEVVDQAYSLIDPRNPERWCMLGPGEALQLLDSLFWDSVLMKGTKKEKKCKNPTKTFRPFREYAVRCLVPISDSMLVDYMPQLVQLMKTETLQDSALARYLMYRSLRNPYQIGQLLYWGLRAEMAACPPPGQHTHTEIDINEVNRYFTLFGLFLRRYVDSCGSHRADLIKQEDLVQQLRKVGRHVKDTVDSERLAVLRNDLRQMIFPKGGVRLPVNSAFRVNGILIEKCRYMDSAKKPIWLTCKNSDPSGDPLMVIFKDGDDVRQDQLCLQMFKIMMEKWEEQDMVIPMVPYGCVTLAYEVGMLEVVAKTNTLSNITKDKAGAGGVWNNRILAEWLQQHHTTPESYEKCVENFLLSCAGYCVATYVLGIADRHNDNILLAESGLLVHIDFGHFLGHVKTAMGFNRDKSPFILTDDFLVIMGGKEGKDSKNFKRFTSLCCDLFNVIRKNANLFINMMSLMFPLQLEELQTPQDLGYMERVFVLDQTDAEAAATFKKLIKQSLGTLMTKINWTAHIIAHS